MDSTCVLHLSRNARWVPSPQCDVNKHRPLPPSNERRRRRQIKRGDETVREEEEENTERRRREETRGGKHNSSVFDKPVSRSNCF